MKKVLLSILAGIVIIGSASAVPSPADRKRLCEDQPDKFVWVEKTQACIPVNPCTHDNDKIREAYCAKFVGLPRDPEKEERVVEVYLENVLGAVYVPTDVPIMPLQNDEDFTAVYLRDGGYIVFPRSHEKNVSINSAIRNAFEAYGYRDLDTIELEGTWEFIWIYLGANVTNKTQCEDIADLASYLYGDVLEWDFSVDKVEHQGKNCLIKLREESEFGMR